MYLDGVGIFFTVHQTIGSIVFFVYLLRIINMPSRAEVGTDKFSFYMRRKHEQELRQAWQVIRCSTKTGSCIIHCSGYKL